jgi:hypothetical protein
MNEQIEAEGALIADRLRSRGYACERIADGTWRSHFRGKHASLTFFVRASDDGFLTFAIVPFLRSPTDSERAARLYERLLELNHELLMAKFSIDDDLDVVLSVEYPTRELDPSEIDDALDAVTFYADRHFEELSALA